MSRSSSSPLRRRRAGRAAVVSTGLWALAWAVACGRASPSSAGAGAGSASASARGPANAAALASALAAHIDPSASVSPAGPLASADLGPFEPPAAPATPASSFATPVSPHAPAHDSINEAASYSVWRSKDGFWHVNGATSHSDYRMQGRVWALDGTFDSPSAVVFVQGGPGGATPQQRPDRFKLVSPKEIAFDFPLAPGRDLSAALRFAVAGGKCVRLYLLVDGSERPALIHIGGSKTPPEAAHFSVCASDGK